MTRVRMGERAMATTEDRQVIRQLAAARDHLLARGDADAVRSLDAILGRLGEPEPDREPVPPPSPAASDLLTAHEAADLLDVRTVAPIWTWVGQGKLAYQWSDGWVKITRSSVMKLMDDPVVEQQRRFDVWLAEALDPFDATDEDLAEIYDWYEVPGTRVTDG
jgi:hypothetical protein